MSDATWRAATPAENMEVLYARLNERMSPAEQRELLDVIAILKALPSTAECSSEPTWEQRYGAMLVELRRLQDVEKDHLALLQSLPSSTAVASDIRRLAEKCRPAVKQALVKAEFASLRYQREDYKAVLEQDANRQRALLDEIDEILESPIAQSARESITDPLLKPPFGHTRSCPALTPGNDDECRCGLEWRVRLSTEITMHAAWRKRAEEAELALASMRDVLSASTGAK